VQLVALHGATTLARYVKLAAIIPFIPFEHSLSDDMRASASVAASEPAWRPTMTSDPAALAFLDMALEELHGGRAPDAAPVAVEEVAAAAWQFTTEVRFRRVKLGGHPALREAMRVAVPRPLSVRFAFELARTLVLVVALIPFFAFLELSRVLGPGRLAALFFSRDSQRP
jgi:hypothetical protein